MQITDETIERIKRGEEVTIIVQGDPSHRLEALLGDICYQAHKHEVQHWNDAPGTDAEKLKRIIVAAREALAIVRECKAKIAP